MIFKMLKTEVQWVAVVCVCVGGGDAFLSSSVFTSRNLCTCSHQNSLTWGNYASETNCNGASLCLLIFWRPLRVSWGSGSDLLLRQNGRLSCDLIHPSTQDKVALLSRARLHTNKATPGWRDPTHGEEVLRHVQEVSSQMVTIVIIASCHHHPLPIQHTQHW